MDTRRMDPRRLELVAGKDGMYQGCFEDLITSLIAVIVRSGFGLVLVGPRRQHDNLSLWDFTIDLPKPISGWGPQSSYFFDLDTLALHVHPSIKATLTTWPYQGQKRIVMRIDTRWYALNPGEVVTTSQILEIFQVFFTQLANGLFYFG